MVDGSDTYGICMPVLAYACPGKPVCKFVVIAEGGVDVTERAGSRCDGGGEGESLGLVLGIRVGEPMAAVQSSNCRKTEKRRRRRSTEPKKSRGRADRSDRARECFEVDHRSRACTIVCSCDRCTRCSNSFLMVSQILRADTWSMHVRLTSTIRVGECMRGDEFEGSVDFLRFIRLCALDVRCSAEFKERKRMRNACQGTGPVYRYTNTYIESHDPLYTYRFKFPFLNLFQSISGKIAQPEESCD